jgi:hypothetical protein
MSREEHRARIPTGEELDQAAAAAPLGAGPAEKRRGLLGFLRVGRIRVSGDVAARKYTPAERRPESRVTSAPQERNEAVQITTPPKQPEVGPGLTPRPIRMDPSVRDRRGLGRSGKHP